MSKIQKMLVGSAGLAMIVGAAAPAAAQQYGYPQYGQPGSGNVVGAIIDSVLGGGRYGSYGRGNDRMAVDQCARAAEARVSGDSRYGGYGNGAYGQGAYGQGRDPRYGQAYGNGYGTARVVAVTQVQRSNNGLRVSGLIDTGNTYGDPRAQGYDPRYQGQGYDPRYQGQGYDPRYPQSGVDPRYGGWNNQGYANAAQFAELRFNCRVDFRGQVTRLNVERNMGRRGY